MTVVVECNILAIIGIDSFQGDDRTSKISADIFNNSMRVAEVRFCIDIKTIFVFAVNGCFGFLKRWTNLGFQLIKQSGILVLPFRIILPEKPGGGYSKCPLRTWSYCT